MLKPDGIVEFIETDPRPRLIAVGRSREEVKKMINHKSLPQTDWTSNIQDRFSDPL
jgi:hypothetical protein